MFEGNQLDLSLQYYYRSLNLYQMNITSHLQRFQFLSSHQITVKMETKLEKVIRELIILLANIGKVYERKGDFSRMNECFLLGDYFSNRLLLYNDSQEIRDHLENLIKKAHNDHRHHLREIWELQRILLMVWPDLLHKQNITDTKQEDLSERLYNEQQKVIYDKFQNQQLNDQQFIFYNNSKNKKSDNLSKENISKIPSLRIINDIQSPESLKFPQSPINSNKDKKSLSSYISPVKNLEFSFQEKSTININNQSTQDRTQIEKYNSANKSNTSLSSIQKNRNSSYNQILNFQSQQSSERQKNNLKDINNNNNQKMHTIEEANTLIPNSKRSKSNDSKIQLQDQQNKGKYFKNTIDIPNFSCINDHNQINQNMKTPQSTNKNSNNNKSQQFFVQHSNLKRSQRSQIISKPLTIYEKLLLNEDQEELPVVQCLTTNKYYKTFNPNDKKHPKVQQKVEENKLKHQKLILKKPKEYQKKEQGVLNLDYMISEMIDKKINLDNKNLEKYNDRLNDYVFQMLEEDFDKKEFGYAKKELFFKKTIQGGKNPGGQNIQKIKSKSVYQEKKEIDRADMIFKNIYISQQNATRQNFKQILKQEEINTKIKKLNPEFIKNINSTPKQKNNQYYSSISNTPKLRPKTSSRAEKHHKSILVKNNSVNNLLNTTNINKSNINNKSHVSFQQKQQFFDEINIEFNSSMHESKFINTNNSKSPGKNAINEQSNLKRESLLQIKKKSLKDKLKYKDYDQSKLEKIRLKKKMKEEKYKKIQEQKQKELDNLNKSHITTEFSDEEYLTVQDKFNRVRDKSNKAVKQHIAQIEDEYIEINHKLDKKDSQIPLETVNTNEKTLNLRNKINDLAKSTCGMAFLQNNNTDDNLHTHFSDFDQIIKTQKIMKSIMDNKKQKQSQQKSVRQSLHEFQFVKSAQQQQKKDSQTNLNKINIGLMQNIKEESNINSQTDRQISSRELQQNKIIDKKRNSKLILNNQNLTQQRNSFNIKKNHNQSLQNQKRMNNNQSNSSDSENSENKIKKKVIQLTQFQNNNSFDPNNIQIPNQHKETLKRLGDNNPKGKSFITMSRKSLSGQEDFLNHIRQSMTYIPNM